MTREEAKTSESKSSYLSCLETNGFQRGEREVTPIRKLSQTTNDPATERKEELFREIKQQEKHVNYFYNIDTISEWLLGVTLLRWAPSKVHKVPKTQEQNNNRRTCQLTPQASLCGE